MDKKTFWILVGIAVAILLILVIWQTAKISSLTGKTVSGKLDTTGWTENEKMNYDMHGTIPARVQGGASSTSAGSSEMVGGC